MRRTFPSRASALAALLVAPLALIVAGCSMEMEPPQPRYEVTHNFIPPASDMGRMCAAQCLTSKDQCLTTKQLSTELAKERCENDERERARKDYASYAKSRKDKGKKGDVIAVFPKESKALVQGVNMVKRHEKPSQTTTSVVPS